LQSMLSEAEQSGNWDHIKKADKWLTDTYQMVDTHGKMAAFKSLVDMGLTAEQAAERVADGYQNLNRVGRAYKYGSQVPIFGPPFGQFMGDLTRIVRTGALYNPIGMGYTVAALKGVAMLLSVSGLAGKGSDEEKKWSKENKLGPQLFGYRFGLKETPQEKHDREDRKGFPKIPMPDFIGDIPLEYKMGGNVLNLARYITPVSVYSGWDTSDDFNKILVKTLPMYWERATVLDVPGFWERAMKTVAINQKDVLTGPLSGFLTGIDAMGNPIADPTIGNYNEEGTLTEGQGQINRLRFLAKGYVPYGGLIDDIIRVQNTGKDYYGRERTLAQVAFRVLGYNAQVWDDSRYDQLVESKGKKYLKVIDRIIGNMGAEFGTLNADGSTDMESYTGTLTKMLLQPISPREQEQLIAKELLIPGSHYVIKGKTKEGDQYFVATSTTEMEPEKYGPFTPIDKTQYDLKKNEQLEKLNVQFRNFNDYYQSHKSQFPTSVLMDMMESLPYKKAIEDKADLDLDD